MNKSTITTILVIVVTLGIGALIAFSGGTPEVSKSSSTGEAKRETAYYKGNPEAKVEIVEFSDFECPACQSASSSIREAVNFYGDNVVFYYRHFPLSQHKYAEKAAKSAEAAGKQGKFWEMHDAIFANQSNFSDDIFDRLASELGMDIEQFKTDLASKEVKNIVSGDLKDGKTLKVNSTPTFFVNGEKVELKGYTLENWKEILEPKIGVVSGE